MKAEELIQKLTQVYGVSGDETRVAEIVQSIAEPLCSEVYINALGSVVMVKKSRNSGAKKVMIDAHIDEIGLMVTGIYDKGFVSFTQVGGTDLKTLLASVVVIHGKREITGVIGSVPPHLAKKEEKKLTCDQLYIDTGLTKKEAQAVISVGDTVSFCCDTVTMGDCMAGKTMDDRASVAAMLLCLSELENSELDVDVYFVGAVQEEVGSRGAKTAAYEINPDAAIAIDVCHAVTPDNTEDAFELGKGIVLTVGPNIHPDIFSWIRRAADRYRIPYQIEACGGDTGTDAWGIQVARDGIPTALISLPLRYMHSSVETLKISDVEDTAHLLFACLTHASEEALLCRE